MKSIFVVVFLLVLSSGYIHAQEKPKSQIKKVKTERKLQYLFDTNGGLIGFYSDGTTASCPRCDLIKENIETMSKQEPQGKYKITPYYIITNGEQLDFYIDGKIARDWAMINYRWIRQPE